MNTIEQMWELQKKLGYKWEDWDFLFQAFRHTSWCNEHPAKPEPNERLEFLGDSVLDLLSAEWLMANMPAGTREGPLSQARALLVKTSSLASRAVENNIGRLLLVGKGAEGLREVESVLADLVEAIIGAAYADGGLSAARQVALGLGVLR